MAKEKFYTSERNVQIVLSLLKANGIRKIIASPGGKSSVSCPLKPSDSAPLKHSTMPP